MNARLVFFAVGLGLTCSVSMAQDSTSLGPGCDHIARRYEVAGTEFDLVSGSSRPVSMADSVGAKIEGASIFSIELLNGHTGYRIRLFGAGGQILFTTRDAQGFSCIGGALVRERTFQATGDGRPTEVRQLLRLTSDGNQLRYEALRITTSKAPLDHGAVSKFHIATSYRATD